MIRPLVYVHQLQLFVSKLNKSDYKAALQAKKLHYKKIATV